MSRQIRLCWVVILFFTSQLLQAQESVLLPTMDQSCSFAGRFEQQRYLSGIDAPLRSEGHFFFHCEHGVIWATDKPIKEALVLQKDAAAYIVKQSTYQKLTSRQHKFLGELLNSLMGGDQLELSERFSIEQLAAPTEYRLKPKQRSLRRGITHIDLGIELDNDLVRLAIVDRNQQKTAIASIREQRFENDLNMLEACAQVESLSSAICELLAK